MERKPDPRIAVIPDIHGHAKGEHKPFAEERPIPYTARMLFLWFFHACRRSSPRFLMVADHTNYLTFEDPAAVNLVRRALKLAQAGDLYGAAETAGVELGHAAVVSEGLRRGMRYSIGAEIDNDPRCRPDAQNIVDAMKPDGMIRSVHFLPITHPQHGENWMWAFDNPEFKDLYDVVGPTNVWEIYMTTLLDAIDKLPGNIVGHFYVPAKFGHWPEDAVLEAYEDRFVAACAERGMAIEVNSRYFYKYYAGDDEQLARYRAAHLRLLGKAKAANVAIAVGSDAHSPKDQGNAFDTILELLDEADVNEIAFPISGRLARVALRATEEIIKAHAAALAAPVAPRAAKPVAESADDGDDDEDESSADSAPETSTPEPVAVNASAVAASVDPAPAAAAPKRPSRAKPKAVAAPADVAPAAVAAAVGATSVDEPAPDAAAIGASPVAANGDLVAASESVSVPETAALVAAAPKKRSHKKGGGTAAQAVAAPSSNLPGVGTPSDSIPGDSASPEHAPTESVTSAAVPPVAVSEPVAVSATELAPEPPAPPTPVAADRAPLATAESPGAKAPARSAPPTRSAPPARNAPLPTTTKTTANRSAAKPAPKSASSKSTATNAAASKSVTKSPAKPIAKAGTKSAPATAARPAAAPKKTSKTAAKAPARSTAAKPTAAKPGAKKPTAKKPVAKTAARPAAKKPAPKKPAAKKIAAKPTAKAPKRSIAAKPAAKKKTAPKKPVAKKKTARGRR